MPRCGVCRENIIGQYVKVGGKHYHKDCYLKYAAPVCGVCGKRIPGVCVELDGKKYHKECYTSNVALKCSLCGLPIEGNYSIDYWGNTYHIKHVGKKPACEYCGRFLSPALTGGGTRYKDKRVVCGLCVNTAVNSSAKGQALLTEVRRQLTRWGIKINHSYGFHLAGAHELAKLAEKRRVNTQELGYTRMVMKTVNRKVHSFAFDIFILSGLPEFHFISTAAHELMHVWVHLNGSHMKLPADILEGSCNYASYLILKQYREKKASYLINNLMTNKDPHYGKGFRKIHDLVRRKGVPHWLASLNKDKR